MKGYAMKKALLVVTSVGCSVLALAQDTSSIDLSDFMGKLETAANSQASTLLPLLGQVATIGLVLSLAYFAFRMVKRFLSGR